MTESGLGFEKFAVVDEMCGHAVPEPVERRLGDLGELAEAVKPVRQGSRGHVRLAAAGVGANNQSNTARTPRVRQLS